MAKTLREWGKGEGKARLAWAARIAIVGVAGLLPGCQREYESPYLPGSGQYAGDEWTRDADGDGVADSVAKYAPECGKDPETCIADAKVVSRIGEDYQVAFGDMILWKGSSEIPPRATWTPEEASARGYRLHSSDTAKVRIRHGRMDALGEGNAQVTAALHGGNRTFSFMVRVVGGEGKRVLGITAEDLTVDAGTEVVPGIGWNPPDARFKEYTLSVDAPSVGWVQGGAVKALFAGRTRVTVVAQDGGHKALFTLKVNEAPHRIEAASIAADDMFLVVGDTVAPVIRWNPGDVTEKRYLLAPADPAVAKADGDRDRIVAVSVGRTQVHVYSLDGGNQATWFTLSVAAVAVPVQGLRADDMNLAVGGSPAVPRLAFSPADATDRRFTLVSDNPYVAGVEGNLIVPLSLGLSPMRAVAADGGHVAHFLVRVQSLDTAIHVDSVQARDLSLTVGSELAPLLAWFPEDAGNQGYALLSADPTVASVQGARVRGETGGNTTVTVTSVDGGKTAAFKVNVVSLHIPVQRLVAEDMDMVAGDVASPALSWHPSNATDSRFTLVSDNAAVARIVDSTAVEALAVGTARVIVRAKDGPADTLQVTVNARAIPVTGIAVADLFHDVGDPDRDVAGIVQWTPANATDKSFRLLSSSNGAAVSLVDNKLRSLASGISRVVIESQDVARLRDTFTVTVRQTVKGVAVRDTSVWPGSADILPSSLITWIPADADNKGFVLTSLDTAVAAIFGEDRVRPRASGTARIVLKSLENALRLDTFKVIVMVPVKSLSVRDTTVLAGMRHIIPSSLVTWNPSQATDKAWYLLWPGAPVDSVVDSVTWRFDAVGPGKVNLILVSSQNDAARDTFAVTVIQPLHSISAANLGLAKGGPDAEPDITWNPANASNKGYSLTGGSPAIAVASGGKVRPVGAGTTTFTVTAADGGKTATFTATVTVPVVGVDCVDMFMRTSGPDEEPTLRWSPTDATNKAYTLASSAPSNVAVVDGKLRAVSIGDAIITVTSEDGAKQGTCLVQVLF